MSPVHSDISELRLHTAKTDERINHLAQRVARLEEWRRQQDASVTDSQRFEIRELRAEMKRQAELEKAKAEAAQKQQRRDRREVYVKVALLVGGALIAMVTSALARLIGWG